MPASQRFSLSLTVAAGPQQDCCGLLAQHSGLAKARIKDAMNKGAVWLQKPRGKRRRLRRARTRPAPGDRLELHYDPELLARCPPTASYLVDRRHFSVWQKPAGLLTQGTAFGDHCSLLRQVELFFRPERQAFPVHRLDREAAGLVLVAHSSQAAARLSALFRHNQVEKQYLVTVRGRVAAEPAGSLIQTPLDHKEAVTRFTLLAYQPAENSSRLLVRIETGRLHQIRRHFAGLGHPVLGDPRYGTGNRDPRGLQLQAVALRFRCPFSGEMLSFFLEEAATGS